MSRRDDIDRARQAWADGEHDRALELLDALIATEPANLGMWSTRGLWLERLGRNEEALEAFRRSTAIQPTWPDHYNAGNALLGLGRPDEAIAEFDASIALSDQYAEAWVNRGIALWRTQRHDEAAASFDRALALDPDFLPGLRCLATLHRAVGRRAESEPHYAHIARLCPDDPQAALELARALGELPDDQHVELHPGGRDWRALEALDRAIALAPDDPRPWGIKASVLGRLMHANLAFRTLRPSESGMQVQYVPGPLKTGRFFDEQVAHCEAAMQRFPSDAWFPSKLADAWEFSGDEARAAELRERAARLEGAG